MTSRPESASATSSALALSVLYVQEIALLLVKIRRMVFVAVTAALALMVTPILVLSGFRESVEEFVPFESELLVALFLMILIVPVAAYFALRSTWAMDRWQSRLDSLSYALRFESQEPQGESPVLRLANQALNALKPIFGEGGTEFDPKDFANSKLGSEVYDVVIPDQVTSKLTDHRGALIAKRFMGQPVLIDNLKNLTARLRSSGFRLWRVLVVSDQQFPIETLDYHSSSMEGVGFAVDLVEETPMGFSVVALGH